MKNTEFDYNPAELDECSSAQQVPAFHHNSFSTTRSLLSSRRVLRDLQFFIEEAKNKENQRIQNMRERQKNISEKVTKALEKKQTKRKQLSEQIMNKQMKQCTFKPKTNAISKSKRNLTQFLESQKAHTKKIEEKNQKLKNNIFKKKQQLSTYKPNINENKNFKKNKQNCKPIHQRLYALKDKQNIMEYESQNNTFKPQINEKSKNMIRITPVQDLLYNQALKRQERENELIHHHETKIQRLINPNNDKYAAQKFIKQYFLMLQNLEIDPSSQNPIEYIIFNELLKSMGFVSCDSQCQLSTKQRSLIHDAYEIMQGTKPNARNICVFLLGIIGIFNINPVNFHKDQKNDPETQLCLDEHEGRKLQKHFDLFFRNRLSSDLPSRHQEEIKQFSFHPKLNPLSEQMAQKHRNAMLDQANVLLQKYPQLASMIPEDGVITHTDLLVLNKVIQDLEKGQKKTDRESQELKNCTFKPTTLSNSLAVSNITDSQSGSKKCFELYSYHKQHIKKKQSLTASRQQFLDPQCTFKPEITRQKPKQQENIEPSKQEQQTLFRMHRGREEYEQKKKFLSRGQKQIKMKTAKQQPILLLDVNLGQQIDKIALFEGDQNKLHKIAQKFAQKHNLDEENQCRLVELLEQELKKVLSRVEEEESLPNQSEEQQQEDQSN